jgi:hypothetical protein
VSLFVCICLNCLSACRLLTDCLTLQIVLLQLNYQTPSPKVGFVSVSRNDYLLLQEYVSIKPLTSNGCWWLRNGSNNRLPRNWLFSCNCLISRCLGSDVSLRSELNCHTDPTLRLFVPRSLKVYHRSLLSEVPARDVTFLGCSVISFFCSLSNHKHRSLHMSARPERYAIKSCLYSL